MAPRAWTLKPYHTFVVEGRHYVYDVFAVVAYEVSSDTHAILARHESPELKHDASVVIPKAGIPRARRESLNTELLYMNLLGELPSGMSDEAITEHVSRSRVNQLVLALSSKCNLRCVYCYEVQNDFRDSSRDMTLETAKGAIAHFFGQETTEKLYVNFMGGETLLRFDLLKEVVAHARREADARGLDIGFKLTTNGTLLDEAKVAFLKKHDFRVVLSLDGPAKLHDQNRPMRGGAGSYLRATRGARKLLPIFPDAEAHVTVTSAGTDFTEILAHHAGLGFKNENINFDFAVADSSAEYAVEEFSELKAQHQRITKGREPDLPGGKLGSHSAFLRTVLTERRDSLVFCGAGLSVLALGPEGGLYPCAGFFGVAEHELGNSETWLDEDRRRSYLDKTLVDRKKECKGCWARMACSGGCAMNAHVKRGDVATPGRQSCDFFRFQLEVAVDSLASERLPENPTVPST